jgi:hypothetical protein
VAERVPPPLEIREKEAALSGILDLPVPFLLLLSLSLAAGVDFPLTLLVLGLSQVLGDSGIQDGAVYPLHWMVLVGMAGLYLVETGSELRPRAASLWHNLQLFLRPLGGFLLALVVLEGFPSTVRLVAGIAAGIVCAFSHVLSWGPKLLFFLNPDRKISIATRALGEDTLLLAFLILVLERPDIGFALSSLLLLLGLILGGPLHQVVRFGFGALRSDISDLLSPPRWWDARELPPWISREAGDLPASGLRGRPAAVDKVPGVRGFRDGFLVDSGSEWSFAFRRRGKTITIPLEAFLMEEEGSVTLARRFAMTAEDGSRSALFLQRKAPDVKSHK